MQIFLKEKNALMHKHMIQFMMLAFKTRSLFMENNFSDILLWKTAECMHAF
jgi:hypothetical protein